MTEDYTVEWPQTMTSRDTMTVHELSREVVVTYLGQDGSRFRVRVRQRPNPIGFHARLPGDKNDEA